ncbi:tRNA (N(6)-L-threonylcarbamoyladenosine(37)-C(2))-methylthiotransferase MtaB [Longirhabdus pacifica]|uniref:tRNA (N(6)-L-threonylcarbamoyladenosine(37)-C(2))- methylthiotransferase MtaB n=1 Tax=Longirhabdus pacifica TaxID=2305227 RepID=UPI0010089A0E|nr:tRNA (N(6)-L-threonylcarbamoyladenosine(37)-C(2))-methylthiotransferase MtaB [Longirhabdus pacifica]
MPTVAFHTLGCKVNFYDTEAIWQMFKQAGYEQVDFESPADVYIVNTCTVTNTGDKKSRQVLRRAIRRNPDAVVGATGCYAQTAPAEILDIAGVDLVIGTQDRDKIVPYVEQIQRERQPINAVHNIMKRRDFEELDVPDFSDRTRAFLKIQDGCNNFCTFCIIPWVRGLSRSRPPENVIKQAKQLVRNGFKEIVLTGIHTGGYGDDLENYSLANLLQDLTEVDGLERIRISSIEASQITDDVIEVLKNSDKMCRHLHVPLQAGQDDVLKRMKRKYNVAEFMEKIKKLHDIMPDVAITTDIIVGFPGETKEMYEEGYRHIKEMQFAEMHVFPYSKRSGTPAAKMDDQVEDTEKQERVQQLIQLSNDMRLEYAQKFVGEVLEVIPEKSYKDGNGLIMGNTDNYLQVVFEGTPDMIGQLCKVKVTEAGADTCKGVFVRTLQPSKQAVI